MKFIIEVDEFYLDEESELAPALQKHVTREVVAQIWGKIKAQVDEKIAAAVQARTEAILSTQINLIVSQLIDAGKVCKNGREIPIADYVKEQFDKSSGWNSPYEHVTNLAKAYGTEMKKRYDYLYANQIVQQMHVIGVLKDEIFHQLIDHEKK